MSCGMLRAFLRGKTHDEYGLLVVILLSVYEITRGHYAWLVPLIVSVGVFVDLWSHCFKHIKD